MIKNLSKNQLDSLKAASESKFTERLIPKSPEEEKQISFADLQEKYGKILVHGFVDGTTLPEDEIIAANHNPSFEYALRKCLREGMENLCCSSVSKGDSYNRYRGTDTGLYMLDGVITDVYKGDAMSGHKKRGETTTLPSTREILRNIRAKGETQLDEIQVRTKPTAMVPYFDLDSVHDHIQYGFRPANSKLYARSKADRLRRYTEEMKQNKLDEYFLYRGQIGSLDKEKFFSLIKPVEQGLPNADASDEEWDYYNKYVKIFRSGLKECFTPKNREQIIHERAEKSLELLKGKLNQRYTNKK